MPATPAPKKDVPGSGATQAQCRDGTFSDAISGENPCRDHAGVALRLPKVDVGRLNWPAKALGRTFTISRHTSTIATVCALSPGFRVG
jgi:hypothetical protein